ncbi:hypothetical protein CC86DRAFT_194014 [Ophiobolus disseminans]|uniref:C2H2-type domain-containing protein n=1 Tax=Ophiobolus disseminans TaxID=1469910 RepID=A0A6A7A6V4_9PLEO|nr:hypothetical protein CC86DRAFT_194014 [Ophiobolus disseminans]
MVASHPLPSKEVDGIPVPMLHEEHNTPALPNISSLDLPDNISLGSPIYTPSTDGERGDESSDCLETPSSEVSTSISVASSAITPDHATTGTIFVCQRTSCNETYRRRCDLNKHVLRVHDKRARCPFVSCPCSRRPFGFEADLRRHMMAKHSTEEDKKFFDCPVFGCEEIFSRKDNMMRHKQKKHI